MPHAGFDQVTLLTGFPSFFPRRLARHILEQEPRTLLYAVVRSKFASEAHEVVAGWPNALSDRLVMLEGDAASMDLGLSGAELRTLAREVDVIHQAAHVTYAGVDRAEAEHVNVAAAQEIVELGRLCRHLRCLAFYSTVAVAGERSGLVLESELDIGQRFASAVAESRAWAEKIVRSAMPELPIAVLRAGTMVGDSTTGEIDRFDGPYSPILHIVSSSPDAVLPLPWRADTPLELVPVDYLVRASHAIARDPRATRGARRTFHLVDPEPLTARAVFEAVARASGRPAPRGYLSEPLSRTLLAAPAMQRAAEGTRAFFERLSQPARYDTTNTDELLSGTGIVCPRFPEYVEPLVRFVQSKVSERRGGAKHEGPPSSAEPSAVKERA